MTDICEDDSQQFNVDMMDLNSDHTWHNKNVGIPTFLPQLPIMKQFSKDPETFLDSESINLKW